MPKPLIGGPSLDGMRLVAKNTKPNKTIWLYHDATGRLLVRRTKPNGEDFRWYPEGPTTAEKWMEHHNRSKYELV